MINNKHKTLIIIGAGGHGKVCIDVAEQMSVWSEIKLIDDMQKGQVLGKEIIGNTDSITQHHVENNDFFVAVGNNYIRKKIFEKIVELGGNIVNLISPHAVLSQYLSMGVGNLFMPLCVLNANVKIGNGNIINTAVVIEHDSKIKNFNHLSPKSVILGGVSIKSLNWIGSGAIVREGKIIERGITVAANSFINKDLYDEGLYLNLSKKK